MSTKRIDNDSTVKMNDGKVDDSADGTARMDAGTAKLDGKVGTSTATVAGVVFASGQTVVLNGSNCVIESLISGNSGEAFVYKITIDGNPFALKHYKPKMALSETAKKVIGKIKDSPKNRIIKIIDFGSYNGQDYEIMEYAEGGTLDQHLKTSGAVIDENRLKTIVNQINEGLQQLHGFYKAIYQDLKPENIYFTDTEKSSLVLADFGISSVMTDDSEEVEVIASATDLYGAPELAHKVNRKEVMATPAVDYFALGITMLELWLGERPFKGIRDAKRDSMIVEEEVALPTDIPRDYATLIQGLIKSQRKDRWGNEQVQKWLNGEPLPSLKKKVNDLKISMTYDTLMFSESENAEDPKELADLLEKYPDMGKNFLYDNFITDWLKKAGNVMLFNKIKNITSQYAEDKDAGLYVAILALDTERAFKSRGGKICKGTEEIADAIMSESAFYMEDLGRQNSNLYLYLEAVEGQQGKEASDTFCKYFREYSPKHALTLVHIKLQSDGGITIGTKHYQNPSELKHEKDNVQTDIIRKAVMEKDSVLLVWLSDIHGDNIKSTEAFNSLSTLEQIFLLGLMPFLSFTDLSDKSPPIVLRDLIDNYPGRSDLFEVYITQDLPLKGQILGSSPQKTPIDYVVCNFYDLCKKHGKDQINNLIRLLCKLGADVDEYSGDGNYPLVNAYNNKNDELINLLLGLGADDNQYRDYVENQNNQQYNQLVQAKNKASSINEYHDLTTKFRSMNGYKDTKALADDCMNKNLALRKRLKRQGLKEQKKSAWKQKKSKWESWWRYEEGWLKTGKVSALISVALSVIIGFIISFSDPDSTGSSIFLFAIYHIPFLFLFFGWSDSYDTFRKLLRGAALCVDILVNIGLLTSLAEESGIFIILMCIFNMLSCILATIFPKDRD